MVEVQLFQSYHLLKMPFWKDPKSPPNCSWFFFFSSVGNPIQWFFILVILFFSYKIFICFFNYQSHGWQVYIYSSDISEILTSLSIAYLIFPLKGTSSSIYTKWKYLLNLFISISTNTTRLPSSMGYSPWHYEELGTT